MQRANQTNYFPEFPGNLPESLPFISWKFPGPPPEGHRFSKNGNSFVNLDSSRFPGIPQNFPEISQKSPRNLPENSRNFPEFSSIAFSSIFVIFWTTTDNDTSENLKEY